MPCQSFNIFVSLIFLWWEDKQCWWETVLKSVSFPVTLSGGYSLIWLCSVLSSLNGIIQNYMHASLYPRFINYLGLYRQTETPSTHCCCALYAGTIKQLHQGCHLESAFPRPPLSQWLMKLCLSSLEITGKMWISELFNLVAKFSPVLHLTKTNLSRTVRVATSNKGHRIEGHQIYKQMENNFLKWCLPEESQG